MKREEMKSTIKVLIVGVVKKEQLVGASDSDVEDASEAVVKVFEKSLEESIGEGS